MCAALHMLTVLDDGRYKSGDQSPTEFNGT